MSNFADEMLKMPRRLPCIFLVPTESGWVHFERVSGPPFDPPLLTVPRGNLEAHLESYIISRYERAKRVQELYAPGAWRGNNEPGLSALFSSLDLDL